MFLCCVCSGRSAGSRRWCILEAVLSAVVFVYVVQVGVGNIEGLLLFVPVTLCIGCAGWTAVSHCIFALKVQGAVDTIVSKNASEIDLLEGGSSVDPLRGVDLFEYHDLISMSLTNFEVVAVVCLFYLYFLATVAPLIVVVASVLWNGDDNDKAAFVIFVVWLGVFVLLLYTSGVVGRIRKQGEPFRTQPFRHRVGALLLVSSMAYAILVYSSPAPFVWRLGLILTHMMRTFKVVSQLRG